MRLLNEIRIVDCRELRGVQIKALIDKMVRSRKIECDVVKSEMLTIPESEHCLVICHVGEAQYVLQQDLEEVLTEIVKRSGNYVAAFSGAATGANQSRMPTNSARFALNERKVAFDEPGDLFSEYLTRLLNEWLATDDPRLESLSRAWVDFDPILEARLEFLAGAFRAPSKDEWLSLLSRLKEIDSLVDASQIGKTLEEMHTRLTAAQLTRLRELVLPSAF